MPLIQGIILGLVQGLTEFIPVSSSGHLVLTHALFGAGSSDLAFDATLQLATVLAVLVYFWKDLLSIALNFFRIILKKEVSQKDKTMVWALVLGTIPAVVFGLLLESKMETVFRNASLVAGALLFGSALMYLAERSYSRGFTSEEGRGETSGKPLTVVSGITIGLYQCLALIPGVSRSGTTISGGLFQGLSREDATRFSFLLSFPIIFGSGLKQFIGLAGTGSALSFSLLVSFLVAFITGYFAIRFLISYLKNHSLNIFIWYRVILAVLILIFI